MMPRKVLLAALLAGVASLLLAFEAAAGGSDPQIVLDEIFGQVSEMCGEGDGRAYDIREIAKTYFTPALATKIGKALDDGRLDFDVLVDGNDCKVTSLDLRVIKEGPGEAVGRAEFENFGEERTVDLVMTKIGDEWKVADIVYRHRSFSIKALH